MKAKKILYITSAMSPFVQNSASADFGKELPKAIQENNHEIRTFTPKWGVINERRNQLHEVIRLSGMNIVIDETDHPLIIKVASLPQARMQIYFIDNDDYFMKRKINEDEKGVPYPDNGERAVFYARGVLETVRKLKWVPDIIHCQGWISAVAPLYIKTAYKDDPSYANCKVVYSATYPEFEIDFTEHLIDCLMFKDVDKSALKKVFNKRFEFDDLQKLAIKYSDGLILDDKNVSRRVVDYAKRRKIPVLQSKAKEDFANTYSDFYDLVFEGNIQEG